MLQKIDAVLFDLDGSLVDSMWLWGDIDREYLGGFGIAVPEGLQDEIEGMSFSEGALYFKNRFRLPDSVEDAASSHQEQEKKRLADYYIKDYFEILGGIYFDKSSKG